MSLGSNLGDRLGQLQEAVRRLAATPGVAVRRVSSVYETDPVGYVDQPPFYNAVAELEIELTPAQLLEVALAIEAAMGRVRTVRWGPRPIDIDLLVCGDVEMATPVLTLPHPRMTERGFVLVPLAELNPDLVVGGRTVAAHLAALGPQTGIRRQWPWPAAGGSN